MDSSPSAGREALNIDVVAKVGEALMGDTSNQPTEPVTQARRLRLYTHLF